jgi:DNA-binding transcriptional MocR family regulator
MFLWCRLPDGLDATEIARRGLNNNIVLAPGNVFSLSQTAGGYLRFNAAMMESEQIFKYLARACRETARG